MVFQKFRLYQKYPLSVNMAVYINKLETHGKSVNLLSKNTQNIQIKKNVDI